MDAILNQKDQDMICVYVAIGKRINSPRRSRNIA
nr:hypothetical protein P5621_19870 [Bacillus subtilis]